MICVIIAGLLATLPSIIITRVPFGDDISFHMGRINAYGESLSDGHLLPQIASNAMNGLGIGVHFTYPPLVPILVNVIHAIIPSFTLNSWDVAINIFIVVVVIFAGLTMRQFVREVFNDDFAGTLSGIAYIFAPYFLCNMFVRFDLAEFLAMAFIPLLFLGIHNLTSNDTSIPYIVVGACGILLAHLLSVIIVGIFAVVFLLSRITKWNKKSIFKLTVSVIVSVGLCAFFILPFLQVYRMDLYNISDHAFATEHKFMTSYFPNYFSIILFDIFSPIASIAHISGPEAVTIAPALDALWGRTFGIWFLVVLLISILLWKYIDVKLKRTIAFYVSLCVITGILSSTLINWAQLPEKFSMLQFSYRFLEIGTFFICALVGPVVVVAIRKLPSKFDISIVKKATVILVISIGLLTTSWIPSNIKYLSITIGMDIRSLDNGTKAEGDMLPQDLFSTMFDYAKGAPPEEMEQLLKVSQSDGVTVEYMERNELSFFVDVISNDAQGTMTLPVIYYPGYKAYISDSGQSIWVRPDANGRVLVTIPPNFHGQIHVFFGMSNTTKLGVAISAFTAFTSLLLGIIWLLKRRNRKHRTLTPASS